MVVIVTGKNFIYLYFHVYLNDAVNLIMSLRKFSNNDGEFVFVRMEHLRSSYESVETLTMIKYTP